MPDTSKSQTKSDSKAKKDSQPAEADELSDEVKPKKLSHKFGPASAIIVTVLAYFGSQLMAGIFIGLYIALSGKSSEELLDKISDSTVGQFVFIALTEIFTLALLYWFIRRRKITLPEIGLGRWLKSRDIGYAAVAFVVYFIILAVLLAVIGKFVPGIDLEQEQQIGFESATGGAELALVFLSLVILVPITEEIMIRGFLYSGLRQKLTKIISALIASLIFGIAHLQIGSGAPPLYVAAIDTFFLSLVLIWLRERTGSLWAGIVVHAIKNGLAFLALFVLKTN